MTLCVHKERSNVWLNLGDSGVFVQGECHRAALSSGLDVVLIKDYSVVAQLSMCGDGRVEKKRLGTPTVSGKNGLFVPKLQSFKWHMPLENTNGDCGIV